jgi:hypothetical protein
MDLRLRAHPRRGPLPWIAVCTGIAMWTVHLVAGAALAPNVCSDNAAYDAINVLTVVTALVTVGAMIVCWQMMRRHDTTALAGGGHVRFLGVLGLLVNAINLLLILLEGGFVVAIHPCVGH